MCVCVSFKQQHLTHITYQAPFCSFICSFLPTTQSPEQYPYPRIPNNPAREQPKRALNSRGTALERSPHSPPCTTLRELQQDPSGIFRAQCKMRRHGPLFKKYDKFQDGDSRGLTRNSSLCSPRSQLRRQVLLSVVWSWGVCGSVCAPVCAFVRSYCQFYREGRGRHRN